MRIAAVLILLAAAGCYDTREGRDCTQEWTPTGHVENRTGAAQSLELSYQHRLDSGLHERRTITVSVPANSSVAPTLGSGYTTVVLGSEGMSGPDDAYCTSTARADYTDMNLTPNSFGSVRACRYYQWLILIPMSESCADFTTEQTVAL